MKTTAQHMQDPWADRHGAQAAGFAVPVARFKGKNRT
jgi:hypothetical protein